LAAVKIAATEKPGTFRALGRKTIWRLGSRVHAVAGEHGTLRVELGRVSIVVKIGNANAAVFPVPFAIERARRSPGEHVSE